MHVKMWKGRRSQHGIGTKAKDFFLKRPRKPKKNLDKGHEPTQKEARRKEVGCCYSSNYIQN